jgi:hypothetical protein
MDTSKHNLSLGKLCLTLVKLRTKIGESIHDKAETTRSSKADSAISLGLNVKHNDAVDNLNRRSLATFVPILHYYLPLIHVNEKRS